MRETTVPEAVLAAVDRFDRPRLGLLASREELTAWAEAGPRGDPPLSPELSIRSHIPLKHGGLVASIVKKAAFGHVSRFSPDIPGADNLIGAGTLGLLMAAMRLDPDRGIKFCTFATYHVRNEVYKAMRAEDDRSTSPSVWLEGISVDRRRGPTAGDAEPPGVDMRTLHLLLGVIPGARDRAIVLERFGAGEGGSPSTFEGIGRKHGVSKERVRQVMKECMRRMRDAAKHRGIGIRDCFLECPSHVA